MPSPNFRFIDSVMLGRGVEAAEASFRVGCECRKDEECQYSTCTCQDEHDEEDEDDELPQRRKKAYAYHTQGRKAGMLKTSKLLSRMPIYECHSGCACSDKCPNRVVDRGRKLPLQIFRTKKTGWGAPCLSLLRAL